MSFSINCLEITATKEQWRLSEKGLYKRLLSEEDYNEFEKGKIDPAEPFKKRFFFNDFYVHNQHGTLEKNVSEKKFNSDAFYGKNINIQAIVGQNGAGKSSLMDLIYVSLNNFACFFTHLMPRSNFFARGVYVKIYFNIGHLEYVLECNDIKIKFYSRKTMVGDPIHYEKKITEFKQLDDNAAIFLAEKIFYTIVSNYAMLSLVPSNYWANCIELSQKLGEETKWNAERLGASWIQRIFHKNDGYTCPIVLNPMRNEGTIDVEKEMRLSKYRLLALLIYAKKHHYSFDNRYELNKIEVSFRNDFVFNKFKGWKKFKNLSPEDMMKTVDDWLFNPDSVSNLIINAFDLKVTTGSMFIKKIALIYLQSKILSLPKYYSYKLFSEGGEYDLKIKDIDDVDLDCLRELIYAVFLDSSHVVTKIHQVVNFLSIKDNDGLLFVEREGFSFFDYEKNYEAAIKQCIAENKERWNNLPKDKIDFFHPPFMHVNPRNGSLIDENREFSLDETIECLPPSILDYEIYLYDRKEKKEISYSKMSAGELQLLHTISTHLYHVRNIMSVNGHRPRYKNINMVFDELEICFHPEYQRLFVKKLVDIIKNLKLNDSHSFNIFLVTHSPFILSDIPQENVMYLRDGCQEEREGKTFAGNLGELLVSGFFLNGTIGNFASDKIDELIDHIEKKNISSEDRLLVEKIGDPLLRSFLKRRLQKEVDR